VVTGSDLAHYEGVPAPSSMRLEKSTNGEDADSETGPEIPVGDAVEWRYVVHNTGVGVLFNVVVTDSDSDVDPRCFGSTASLSPGDSIVCTASGTAGFGQYMNLGEALAKDGASGDVRSSDPSHYFGVQRPGSIDIEKSTNGVDADVGPGPSVEAGTVVSWLYVVVNDGTVPLTNVEVTDSDASLQVECPELPAVLQPGDQFVCEATGLAEPIDYSNLGTVTAETTDGASVTDTDRSHYRGFTPEFR